VPEDPPPSAADFRGSGPPTHPGWALPDSNLSPVPVAPPQPVHPHQWSPPGPPGRRPMPTWAKVVLGLGVAYYAISILLVITGVIVYFVLGTRR
jgi:hypothetical protein